jgi:hypothetical protein
MEEGFVIKEEENNKRRIQSYLTSLFIRHFTRLAAPHEHAVRGKEI